MDRDLAVLVSESGIEPLHGRLNAFLAPFLTGLSTVPEIIAQLEGTLDPIDVLYGIDELRRHGYVIDAGSEPAFPPAGEILETVLRARGVELVPEADAELTIAVVDDYLSASVEELAASGNPWLPVKPSGRVAWVGPLIRPGHAPSWACVTARLRAVREAWGVPVSPTLTPPALHGGRWIRTPDDESHLGTLDLETGQWQLHAVECGGSAAAFQPREARNADDTFTRFAHLISPLTGIVHSVVPAADSDLHVFTARHNFRTASHPSRSFGKGTSEAAARTSALCEALERYSAIFRGDEPLLRAPYRELCEEAIHPSAILGFSERQYARRESWNRRAPRHSWIPEQFDETLPTDWVAARSLTEHRTRYVAAAICYSGYPAAENEFCRADSNGNAAGSSLDDAVLQGLLELVERDAVGIWWYNRIRRPGTELEQSHGRRVWILDLTTDLGIPVAAALSSGRRRNDVIAGFGAHPDPATAAARAIAEMNLSLAALLAGRHERTFTGRIADRTFLEPDPSAQANTPIVPPDVAACVDRLRARGLEVLVLDQTREDVGLPVVKVIVPGLRHFRPRFAPGRLYDVPVRLGWLERPLAERELNRVHLAL